LSKGHFTTLEDVCESIRYGYTASASFEPCGPRFLRITDIVADSLDWESVPYCKIDDADRQRFALAVGDIVVARTGATVGYAKFIREPVDAVFASYLVRFRVDQAKAELGYIGRLVESHSYKKFVQSRIGGAAQPNASAPILGSFKFLLPSRYAQIRIAEILSAYDDLIENNRRRMALLEEAARQIYCEWFVRLRFPGHEHTRNNNGVPEGWKRQMLAELCESIDYGYTASAELEEVGPKFLRITDIVPNIIDWTSVPYCPIEENRLVKFRLVEGDIVIARTGATVGYAKRLHRRHPEAVFASYLVRLRLKPEIDSLMVGIFVESDSYKSYVHSRVGGAAQPNANAKVLSGVEILVPPPSIQRLFHESVEPLIDQREVLQIQNQKLQAARDLLLPRLMSGEIAV
jgi:type I restriction enzyme S subunit